jgi:hypothetical protein
MFNKASPATNYNYRIFNEFIVIGSPDGIEARRYASISTENRPVTTQHFLHQLALLRGVLALVLA